VASAESFLEAGAAPPPALTGGGPVKRPDGRR
jgi:hypothetical protein